VNNPIKNYVYRTLADISLAKQEMGYKPKWTLDSGIRYLVKLYEKSKLLATSEV
jgi:nucleoside-diphosphate-sugar epimerase